jgi:hypothetical protein
LEDKRKTIKTNKQKTQKKRKRKGSKILKAEVMKKNQEQLK